MNRLWRWLTCGHGHHAFSLHAGLDLAGDPQFTHTHTVVARSCPRCGLVEVLE